MNRNEGDKVKELEAYRQTKPVQLTLFDQLTGGKDNKKYSNVIALYDEAPKYIWGKQPREIIKYGEILPILKRDFECGGDKYKLTITPARLEDKDGITRDYYPSQREELIEDVLRKLAAEGRSLFLDDLASVKFSLYQVQQEIKRLGRTYTVDNIKHALDVCLGTKLEIATADGGTVLKSHMFDTVALRTLQQWREIGGDSAAYVRFNQLVTRGIENMQFRRINYHAAWSYKRVIARQLYKRMAQRYTQASVMETYEINLTTLIRDFGLTPYDRLDKNLRDVELALEEMMFHDKADAEEQEKGILIKYYIDPRNDSTKRKKFTDAKITLMTHPCFNEEMRESNRIKKMLQASKETSPK